MNKCEPGPQKSDGSRDDHNPSTKVLQYLHVGPSGDCWTGSSIFAAKHLQPDYVKSVPLPENLDPEHLLQRLEDDMALAKKIYDDGEIPESFLTTLLDEEKDQG